MSNAIPSLASHAESRPAGGGSRGSLAGIRVLDIGRFIAGPMCGNLLADLGADVVKLEAPGGEVSRYVLDVMPNIEGNSTYVLVHNHNKRSATVDLRRQEGRDLLRAMIAKVDVLVENYRPGILSAMGCSPEVLLRINPRLVIASVSGFGQTGPWAGRGALDPIVQAMGGLMGITGFKDGPATQSGAFIADYLSAVYTAFGVVCALYERERSGHGQVVDVSMLEAVASLLSTHLTDYFVTGHEPERFIKRGNRDPYRSPANSYETRDGAVQIIAFTDGHFAGLMAAIGRPDLLHDERFSSPDDRLINNDALDAEIVAWTSAHTSAEALKMLEEHGVLCGSIASVTEVAENPQLRERGFFVNVEHEVLGQIPLTRPPITMSRTPVEMRRPPALLGEHTDEVLRELAGCTSEELATFREQGII